MEIRNNTSMYNRQSFGMAFLKPVADDIPKFKKYLLDAGMSPDEIKKALQLMVERHAKDVHFDFKYDSKYANSFQITPKTPEAENALKSGKVKFFTDVFEPGSHAYDSQEMCDQRCKNRLEDSKTGSFINKKWAKLSNYIDRKMTKVDRHLDPTTALPGNMRYTDALVKRAEAKVNKLVQDKATMDSAMDVFS